MTPPIFRIEAPGTPWHGLPADDLITQAAQAAADPELHAQVSHAVTSTRSLRAQILLRTLWSWQRRGLGLPLEQYPKVYQQFVNHTTGVANLSPERIADLLGTCPAYPVGLVRLYEALRAGVEVDANARSFVSREATLEPGGAAVASEVRNRFKSGLRTLRRWSKSPEAPIRAVKLVLHEQWDDPTRVPRPPQNAHRFLALMPPAVLESAVTPAPTAERVSAQGPQHERQPVPPERRAPARTQPREVEPPQVEIVGARAAGGEALPQAEQDPAARRPLSWALGGRGVAVFLLALLGGGLVGERMVAPCPTAQALSDARSLHATGQLDQAVTRIERAAAQCWPAWATQAWEDWANHLRQSRDPMASPVVGRAAELDAWERAWEASGDMESALAWIELARELDQDVTEFVDELDTPSDPELAAALSRTRFEVALERLDLETAEQILQQDADLARGWGPLLASWSKVHALEPGDSETHLVGVDLDKDPSTPQVWLGSWSVPSDPDAGPPTEHYFGLIPDPLEQPYEPWGRSLSSGLDTAQVVSLDGRPLLVLGTRVSQIQVWTLDPETGKALRRVDPLTAEAGHLMGVAVADLDQDGRQELHLAASLQPGPPVHSLAWADDGQALRPVRTLPDAVQTLGAHPAGMISLGPDRLLLALESWYGHGLFEVDSSGLVDRRLVGDMRRLVASDASTGRIVTTTHDLRIEAPRWPDVAAPPLPSGVQVWEHGPPADALPLDLRLERAHEVPVPGSRAYHRETRATLTDLDGDGFEDLVVQGLPPRNRRVVTEIFRGLGKDGPFSEPLVLRGLQVLAVRRRPGEPSQVVLSSGSRRFITGREQEGHTGAPRPPSMNLEPGAITSDRGSKVALRELHFESLDPLAVAFPPSQGLIARLVGPDHRAFSVPVTITNRERVEVDVDLELQEMAYDSFVRLGIVFDAEADGQQKPDAPVLGPDVHTVGGAGSLDRVLACGYGDGRSSTVGRSRPTDASDEVHRVRLRTVIDLSQDEPMLGCGVWRDGVFEDWWAVQPPAGFKLPEHARLSLFVPRQGPTARSTVHIHDLHVEGVDIPSGGLLPTASAFRISSSRLLTEPGRKSDSRLLRELWKSFERGDLTDTQLLQAMVMAEHAGKSAQADDYLLAWLDRHDIPDSWRWVRGLDAWTEDHELIRAGVLWPEEVGSVLDRHDADLAQRFWMALVYLEVSKDRPLASELAVVETALLLDPDPAERWVRMQRGSAEYDTYSDMLERVRAGVGALPEGVELPAGLTPGVLSSLAALDYAQDNDASLALAAALQARQDPDLNPIRTVDLWMADEAFYRLAEEHRGQAAVRCILSWGRWRPPIGDQAGQELFPESFGWPGTPVERDIGPDHSDCQPNEPP